MVGSAEGRDPWPKRKIHEGGAHWEPTRRMLPKAVGCENEGLNDMSSCNQAGLKP